MNYICGKLVSIIVPVYNCWKYLQQCLESIIAQTYDNLEIILVDDGSIDDSRIICDEYAKKDQRIIVIHKNNEGVSAARNKGIDNAHGEFILFIDADDLVQSCYVQKILDHIEEADIVISAYKTFGTREHEVLLKKEGRLSREEVFYNILCSNIIHGSCWNKIFRMNIIKRENLRFSQNISVGEDMAFLVKYLQYCSSYYYINKALYLYRKHSDSVMQRGYNCKIFDKDKISVLDSVDMISTFLEAENKVIKKYVSYKKIRNSMWLMLQMILAQYKDKQIFIRIRYICKNNYFKALPVKTGSKLQKLAGFLLMFSPLFVYKCGVIAIHRIGISLEHYLE